MRKIITRRGKLVKKIKAELTKEKTDIEKILEAVDNFEKDNVNTINKLKKNKQIDTKRINGALKQTINAHGPITKLLIGSASKRIYGALISGQEDSEKYSIKSILIGLGVGFLISLLIYIAL